MLGEGAPRWAMLSCAGVGEASKEGGQQRGRQPLLSDNAAGSAAGSANPAQACGLRLTTRPCASTKAFPPLPPCAPTADPALRPSAQDILRHPWCAKGMDADTMLCCNDGFLSKSRTNPPPPKVRPTLPRFFWAPDSWVRQPEDVGRAPATANTCAGHHSGGTARVLKTCARSGLSSSQLAPRPPTHQLSILRGALAADVG